jgi:hypothetical protein
MTRILLLNRSAYQFI